MVHVSNFLEDLINFKRFEGSVTFQKPVFSLNYSLQFFTLLLVLLHEK